MTEPAAKKKKREENHGRPQWQEYARVIGCQNGGDVEEWSRVGCKGGQTRVSGSVFALLRVSPEFLYQSEP